MRRTIWLGPLYLFTSVSPVEADPFETLSSSHWAEACANSGTREAENWFLFHEREWCEEMIGDHGRVISTCFAVIWSPAGPSRWRADFTDDTRVNFAELVSPNRLSIYEDKEGHRHQLHILGRANHFEGTLTHRIKCK